MAEKRSKKSKLFDKSKQYTRKLKLSEIQEIALYLVVVKREFEQHAIDAIKDNRGTVISRSRGKGVSRTGLLSGIGSGLSDVVCIFAIARTEEIQNLALEVARVLDLEKPGVGKAMVIDVDGYMGAKAPMVGL